MAKNCSEKGNTCSNCAGTHRTDSCLHLYMTRCISCKSDEHASWSRQCPTFLKRVAEFKERNPESQLPYFPTVDPWTWSTDATDVTHFQKVFSSPKKVSLLSLQKRKEKALAENTVNNTQQGLQDPEPTTEAQEREFRDWWGNPQATRPSTYTTQHTQPPNLTQSGTAGPSDV